MQTHTPHTPLLIRVALLGTALFLLSCTKTVTDGPERPASSLPDGAITFSDVTTRALINSAEEITSFNVWGYYVPDNAVETGEGATQIFTGDLVTKDEAGTSWSYENLQMWKPDVNYDFYAIFSRKYDELKQVGLETQTAEKPYMVIAFYDIKANQDDDLMFAAAENISYNPVQGARPVSFTFSHLLSQVEFMGKVHAASAGIEGFDVKIKSAKLYGLYTEGDFSAEKFVSGENETIRDCWTIPGIPGESNTTVDNPYIKYPEQGNDVLDLSENETSILGSIMVFPQTLTSDVYLEIIYSTDGGINYNEQKFQLISAPLTTWEAGKRYSYSFTVSDNDRILFDAPTVNGWDEATGGIIIVD